MILVTGASGIVGHHVVTKLLKDGHKVRATKREGSDISKLTRYNEQIEWVNADVLDVANLEKAFAGIDYVVHCAAIVSFHQEDKARMMEVNVIGTANMVNIALDKNIKKFVHVSSVAALGRKPNINLIDEEVKWETSDNNSNYAESKYLGELEVWRAQEEGLTVAIVNPSIVLGPGSWDSSSMQLFKYVKQGRLFYPPGEMNYVDVRDVANIITILLFNEFNSEKFILNANKAAYKDVFNLIAIQLNKKAPKFKVSRTLLTFAYILDTIKSKLFGTKAIITRESLRLSKMDYMFSNKKVSEVLDYKFVSLEDSIAWTCKEIQKQNL